MRECLVKYTDVLDFEVEQFPGCYWTKIRWKLPKLTDEEEAAMRDQIHAQFGPQDSGLLKAKVVEWKIVKRKRAQWYFEIYWKEPKYQFTNENCKVTFHFHDGQCMSGSSVFCGKSPQIISKGADVECLLQIGNSEVLFNDLRQETRAKCIYGSESFAQSNKWVPLKICNQLKNVPIDQVSVTVFGTFPEGNQRMGVRSNFDWSTSRKPNWKSSDVADTDVSIESGDSCLLERISCHSNFFTRNSRVLSELLVSPTLKPFRIKLRDLSKIQVEAFLSYQYNGVTDKILEAPPTSLGVLRAAERYEIWQMWTDTMKGLLDKDPEWFEGEVGRQLTDFLGKCSKREEDATQNLIQKIAQERRHSQRVEEKSANEESEKAGENCETGENGEVEENPKDAESARKNLDAMKQRGIVNLARMLDSKSNCVPLLEVAQGYQNDGMWNDIIAALLVKDSEWFELGLALELKTFLDSCSKRDDDATQKLTKTLSQLLEQPKPTGETTQVREQEDQSGEIVENTMNSGTFQATVENPDQLLASKNSRVETLQGPATVDRKLRRSARLQAGKRKKRGLKTEEEPRKKELRLTAKNKTTATKPGPKGLAKPMKRKPVQKGKRGLPTEDVTWTKALKVGAENERNASKSWGGGPGPRDIWKDPLLPKISIFPDIADPEVKVEKVEPPEEESEDSPEKNAVEIQQVVLDQDYVAVTVKEEEPIPKDESSVNDNESSGYGVIESSWSLRQPTDENI